MSIFVMPTTLTYEGMKTLKHKSERIKEIDREVMEKFGVKIIAQCACWDTMTLSISLKRPITTRW